MSWLRIFGPKKKKCPECPEGKCMRCPTLFEKEKELEPWQRQYKKYEQKMRGDENE